MTETVEAEFTIDSWDEKEFDEVADAAKLTRATVAKSYSGEVEGTSTTEWLMSYADDGSATFVGLERIVGKVGNRCSSCKRGFYADGTATASCQSSRLGSDDRRAPPATASSPPIRRAR